MPMAASFSLQQPHSIGRSPRLAPPQTSSQPDAMRNHGASMAKASMLSMSPVDMAEILDTETLANLLSHASRSGAEDPSSFLLLAAEAGDHVKGTINWSNPAEAAVGALTLAYIGFSIWAGLKYVLKDGWRPKL
eukprot:CAMPEP_0198115614 /NCGR_PEP_ID=MMETSP1442-20131203/6662_1 /TAXON_ID= /ORGANISM="Craspedostauros australis, Strain CCMP3328" /LENGTH=133 /DNA_ID=CAMNT_0043773155 /DNA_START=306 /DNA_END=707 /DNA_ORIENTATION=-